MRLIVSESSRAGRRRFLKYVAGAFVAAAAAAAGYNALAPSPPSSPTTLAPPTTATTSPAPMTSTAEVRIGLTSQAFGDGERIPSRYTCDDKGISPPISWNGAAKGTRSYTLIMEDLDAPMGTFTHWVIFNIPATETGLEEDVETTGSPSNGAIQGRNDFGEIGYGGPCPPSGVHRYILHLYVLDTLLNLQEGATKQDVLNAMKGHILAEAELTGLYSRG
jgi:Raf kinase inhibitor-like YbhB/YbcL family protein